MDFPWQKPSSYGGPRTSGTPHIIYSICGIFHIFEHLRTEFTNSFASEIWGTLPWIPLHFSGGPKAVAPRHRSADRHLGRLPAAGAAGWTPWAQLVQRLGSRAEAAVEWSLGGFHQWGTLGVPSPYTLSYCHILSLSGGTSNFCWVVFWWKVPSFEMDDHWGYTY